MNDAIAVLQELLDSLPTPHHERAGIIRAIEVLRIEVLRLSVTRLCVCGEVQLVDGSTVELAGVKHRADGPCFKCDTYGNPL